ncbi:MAG: sensor histidine kinase [Acidobacteriaceae bacterium]
MSKQTRHLSILPTDPKLAFRYAAGVLVVMFASLLAFWLLLRPPLNDLGRMALYLSATALFSISLGYVAYRTGWLNRAPSLRLALLAGYALSSLLTFLNVWITAKLMFASQHDLFLATILLIFASGIAMSLGLFLSSAQIDRIHQINRAAQEISNGRLDVRIESPGTDEMAELARMFNKMTAQLQAADQKQRKLENLRRDLIAWVSHDLQTPLASMRVIVEALSDGMVTDAETEKRYLDTIQKDISELSELIDDLFQMTQLDAGGLVLDWNPSSLVNLVSDTVENFYTLASRHGIELTASISPGVDIVYMDTRRIGRVLNNLISNALRHTQPGGAVQVHVERLPGKIRLKVADTGEGISAEDLPYVFDRFYRGEKSRNRKTGGSGLGLAIARGIVEAHGGEISVESSPGSGSTFYFTLPEKMRSTG